MSVRPDKVKLGFLLAVCCLALAGGQAAADNWPRFRGPHGAGTAADKDIPITWSDKQGLLWKTAIPGAGNSSPVVWGDHVFLQSSTDDASERMLLCLSAKDGRILWLRTVPGGRFVDGK